MQEQRVTGLAIHCLIGATVLLNRHLLRQIPVSVLTGLFLYLGLSSVGTTDLFRRSMLFLEDSRDIKSAERVPGVRLGRAKLFTSIQLGLLGAMWAVKGTSWGVFFPVLIGLLAPVRIALARLRLFSKRELAALDGELE